MKNLILIKALLIISFNAFSQDTINQYLNNQKTGFWIVEEEHSEIMEVMDLYTGKGYYKNDKKNGLWNYFDQSGLKVFSIGFNNGLKDSVITYHFNENIYQVMKSEMENHYIIYSFYESGKPLDTIIRLDTITKYIGYWENGNVKWRVISYGDSPNDHSVYRDYYESGELSKIEMRCCGNYKNGIELEFYKSGVIKSQMNYKKDKLHGEYIQYHKNGFIKEKCTYINGERHDKCYYYNDKGTLIDTKTFKNGVEIKH